MGQSGSYARTKNSLRNSFVAVGLQVIALLIGFWSRRIFLNHLGTEVLGLNTTATSLLSFLNLAELGIGSAIAVTLYKPIFNNDKQTIKEIVALQGWLYRVIALIVLGGSAVLMIFFPMIFNKTPLPLWYAYASFGVLLYSSLLGYFFNYKQILLDAHQLNYKIQLSTKFIAIFKLVAQTFAVKFLPGGYIWWLALEVVFATITAIILSRTVNRTFPYIKDEVKSPALLRHKYPEVATKVKQLFVHKMAGFVVSQTIPLIIYAYATLTLVAKYGNYLIFTNNLNAILGACFLGLAASVGNLVAEGNKELTLKVFRELYSVRFFMTAVCSICLWFLVDPFISIWIGDDYLLDRSTVLLIIIVFFIQNTRNVVDIYLNAYGMYRDIWAPIVESALCLGLSILLGHFYDINGILIGLIISQLIIVKIWKPYFLFKCGLQEPMRMYCGLTFKHLAMGAVTLGIMDFIASKVSFDPSASFGAFFIYACPFFALTCIIMFALLYTSEQGMRGFVDRMFNTFSK